MREDGIWRDLVAEKLVELQSSGVDETHGEELACIAPLMKIGTHFYLSG